MAYFGRHRRNGSGGAVGALLMSHVDADRRAMIVKVSDEQQVPVEVADYAVRRAFDEFGNAPITAANDLRILQRAVELTRT